MEAPGEIEEECDAEWSPDGAVFHKGKGGEGVWGAFDLPDDEDGNAEDADDERSNDVDCLPLGCQAAGDGERGEDEAEDGDD